MRGSGLRKENGKAAERQAKANREAVKHQARFGDKQAQLDRKLAEHKALINRKSSRLAHDLGRHRGGDETGVMRLVVHDVDFFAGGHTLA